MGGKRLSRVERAHQYVQKVARPLGLAGWHLSVVDGGECENTFADVVRIGTIAAQISLYQNFWVASAKEKRLTIVHELLHLHTWGLVELIPDSHATARTDVEERLVDTLAEIISPLLPPWTGG